MHIRADNASAFQCPFHQMLNCVGPRCGAFRWVDREKGYCGAGGPPGDKPDAPLQSVAPAASTGRVDRQTTQGVAPRGRR